MRITWSNVACRPFLALMLSVSVFLIAGCNGTPFTEGGPEMRFLTSKPPIMKAEKPELLPLTAGSRWEMHQIGAPDSDAYKIDIVATAETIQGGQLLEVRRNGKLWRREVYKDTTKGLYLAAMGEDNNPIMQLSPPVPLISYPITEGQGQTWTGIFRYGSITYPANAYSRISALENVSLSAGTKMTYRTDTLVSIIQKGNLVKFPTIRWLTPNVGFVRRSFVDQGRPIYFELQKFTPGQKSVNLLP